MKIRPDLRMTLLAAALAASAVSAWATYSSTLIPALTADAPPPKAQAESAAAPAVAVKAEMALAPNETVVVIEDVEKASNAAPVVAKPLPAPAPAPVVEATRADDAITITKPRLTEDQRIQAEVMERLASNPRLTGKIGVESHGSVVHLSGYLLTSGQVWHAENDARSIRGVRHVVNDIRAKVGARMS